MSHESVTYLKEEVPVWLCTWGTCMALIPAATRSDAKALVRARDEQLAPGRTPLRGIEARRATERDRQMLDRISEDLAEVDARAAESDR